MPYPRTEGKRLITRRNFGPARAAASAALVLLPAVFGCGDSTTSAPPRAPPGAPPVGYSQPSYYPPPPAPYGQSAPSGHGFPPYYAPPSTQTASPPPIPVTRPLLGPLVGATAWQSETRAVAKELVAHLSARNQVLVATIPLVFDPNPNEVNAFAGCDDSGAPFVAGTEGLLEAIDGIAQTRSTDEIFSTNTYGAYVAVVAPRLVSKDGGSAMLPSGIIPAAYWSYTRRISRAHEMFDEIVAFTFGHELSHHYLGHTGCATGQTSGPGPAIAQLGMLATAIMPGLNQPNEIAADSNGCVNVLDTGAARGSQAFRWSEEGGLWLLDFFARLEQASGASPWLGFLRTHPNPGLRIPIVQGVAATWRYQHR